MIVNRLARVVALLFALCAASDAAFAVCNINGAGMKAREDTEKLNANLQTELAAKGFTFNQPDLKPFREKLRQAGFYAEWKAKYGDEAWAILEKNAGKLT